MKILVIGGTGNVGVVLCANKASQSGCREQHRTSAKPSLANRYREIFSFPLRYPIDLSFFSSRTLDQRRPGNAIR
jgi:hypothetical protein